MFDPTPFNALDLVPFLAVGLGCALIAFAGRRAERGPEPPAAPPGVAPSAIALRDFRLADDLKVARSVRASYGGLPYRRAR